MKTCKDCIHYDLCNYNTYEQAKYFGKDKEVYITIKNNSPCKFFTADVVPKSEINILKSLITQKEGEAYSKGYEDGKADIFNSLDNRLAYYRMYAEVNPLIATILQIVDDVRKENEEVSK